MTWLIKLVINVVLLFAFNAFGWLELLHDGSPITIDKLSGPIIVSVVIVAVILWIASIVAFGTYVLLSTMTLGIGLLLFPLITWFALIITAHFMPGSLVLHGFWMTLLCGVIIGIAHVAVSQDRQAISS